MEIHVFFSFFSLISSDQGPSEVVTSFYVLAKGKG